MAAPVAATSTPKAQKPAQPSQSAQAAADDIWAKMSNAPQKPATPKKTIAATPSQRRTWRKTRLAEALAERVQEPPPGYKGPRVGEKLSVETAREIAEAASRNENLFAGFVQRILVLAWKHLKTECSPVMRVTIPREGKLVVVGDLHGQLTDLMTIFEQYGYPDANNKYVFNGDFVDRGPHGLEILLVLYTLLMAKPDCVFLNRGNHEEKYICEGYDFKEQVTKKYSDKEFELSCKTFKYLPLATVVNDVVFIVHGAFAELDSDRNGSLSYKEFYQALNRFNLGLTDEQIYDLFNIIDTDQSGTLSFREFDTYFTEVFSKLKQGGYRNRPTEKRVGDDALNCSAISGIARVLMTHKMQIKRFFEQMDVDMSGELSFTEFKVGMSVISKLLDKPLTEDQVKKLFELMDKDHSGLISLEELSQGFTC
eukprot:m51a1_g2114 putative serine threonine-protein phosphatase with ef-hands 1 (425) ;mRNA; r:1653037-1655698